MLGHFPEQQVAADPETLIPWLRETVLRPEDSAVTNLQVRLRGNILHVLCEAAQTGPARDDVLLKLVRSLMDPTVKSRLESDFPQIYQIYVYSRQRFTNKPIWSAPIYLNRLEQHLVRLVPTPLPEDHPVAQPVPSAAPDAALADSPSPALPPSDHLPSDFHFTDSSVLAKPPVNFDLACQGEPAAIAQYLSEALSDLNVGVQVSARVAPGKARRAKSVVAAQRSPEKAQPALVDEKAENTSEAAQVSDDLVSRLWVFCEASYSPDPLLIAEPIAERLRQLQLRQFQDAVITIQVAGEAASDWRLRVDLTPPEEMLREWGRWGDIPAISQLANQISQAHGLKLVTEVKQATLHLISYVVQSLADSPAGPAGKGNRSSQSIDIDALVGAIAQMLVVIAPQGLHRAMLYGPSTDDISPEWLRGFDLPGGQHPELAESTASLAAKGNLPALAYCLTRALNPDIQDQLATGGIRVQLLLKEDLLHVMTDGPVCPPKHAIVPLVTQTLKQLAVPDLGGIRLYGRRAGQRQPIWSHGHDYQPRPRLVPEAKPEFAASEAYIGELITPVSDESLQTDLPADEQADTEPKLGSLLVRSLQYVLIKSQLFTPADQREQLPPNLPKAFKSEGSKIALVWGAVGLLLAVQFDFMVGQALRQAAAPAANQVAATQPDPAAEAASNPITSFRDELASLNWNSAQNWADRDTDEGFVESDDQSNNRDFTASAIDDDELIYSPQQDLVSTSILLAGSALPSFRSQQLDEKLALYQRQVAQSGPPDVLVIGSSRALRGVDPAALQQALAGTGHSELSVFNFGVNGATAQVVDLIVRRLIPPEDLPQIVVWADGARAFNSGRVDVTYNAIAVSEGYEQIEASSTPTEAGDIALGSLAAELTLHVKAVDRQLSEVLGQMSSAYVHRGKIRSAIGQGFGAIAPEFGADSDSTRAGDTPTGLPTETSLIDFDGFLALSTRFNPATYYQDHARVAGAYDGDYEAFQLAGKQTAALDNLLTFAREKQLPIVFINTPLTDEYLDSHRAKAEDDFQHYMLKSAERSNLLTFRDLGQLWPQRYDYFSDPSHLNRYGAYQVSHRLAQDPMIPWPTALPDPEE